MATSFHVWEEASISRIYITLKLALLQPGIVQTEKVKGAKTSAGTDRQGGEGKNTKSPRNAGKAREACREGVWQVPSQRLGLTGCWDVQAQCPQIRMASGF